MGDTDAEVIVAAVALIVSLVALSATFMQVLQQYYASAHGYSECNEKVMGRWAETKSRKFSWHELRYEVEFESPVIFVARPSNRKGPVRGARIVVLDGSEESIKESRTSRDVHHNTAYDSDLDSYPSKETLHTADNERASWLELLSAVQRMELESSTWQTKQFDKMTAPPRSYTADQQCPKIPSLHEKHTLAVAVQGKKRSWVTMPQSITKPYATTTICHLIEMVAALGIYWHEFDRRRDRYRAEGNGFVVMGERLSGLGLCFSFQTYGKCYFEEKRVVPADEIKELCFGYVPTIFLENLDQRRLDAFGDEQEDLGHLQMASRSEIAESLVLIGCNNNTVNYFRDLGSVTSHLFPVSFEILGMLCQPIHIQHTYFTFVPNPTPDRWDKRSLSLAKLMRAFEQHYEAPLYRTRNRNKRLQDLILGHIHKIQHFPETAPGRDKLFRLKALSAALQDVDEVLTGRAQKSGDLQDAVDPKDPVPQVHPRTNGSNLQDSKTDPRRRSMVLEVLRSHFQELLQLLNDTDKRVAETQPLTLVVPSENTAPSGSHIFPDLRPRGAGPKFQDMNAASPDDRQDKFMHVYFKTIREKVVKNGETSRRSRRASHNNAPLGHRLTRRASGGSRLGVSRHMVPRDKSPVPSIAIRTMSDDFVGAPRRQSVDVYLTPQSRETAETDPAGEELAGDAVSIELEDEEEQVSLAEMEVTHEDVWCTLVFRMICWLMLHDFNKMDVQLPKSELRGSRMPVYIS